MFLKNSLLSYLARLAVAAIVFPGCSPLPSPHASAHVWPTHGTQYYNYWDAKYLGSDSADQLSYRLIDSATFADIRSSSHPADNPATFRSLIDSSCRIIIDSTRIQADLQWVKDSSRITGREYQIYLYIDRNTATISSVHGEPGTNNTSHPFIESDRNHGIVSPIPPDSPGNGNRILIGQVHGHPASAVGITLHRMSPDDSLTAVCLQAPIYAVDAMDGSQGTPGSIHRANPDPGMDFKAQDLYIGKTRGSSGFNAGNLFNIGLNALQIWGISRQPDFEELIRIDKFNMAAQPRHHPDANLDRGFVDIKSGRMNP
ncbi:MAG TPA: hypothetical protein VMH27_14830 [Puia sp.]|nr:hypothetical protein [Puia sp.]